MIFETVQMIDKIIVLVAETTQETQSKIAAKD